MGWNTALGSCCSPSGRIGDVDSLNTTQSRGSEGSDQGDSTYHEWKRGEVWGEYHITAFDKSARLVSLTFESIN